MSCCFRNYARVIGGCLTVALTVRADAAAPPTCSGTSIRFEQSLGPDWKAAAAEVSRDLAARANWDRCAVVTVSSDGLVVVVQVALPDGRSALRRVHRPGELPATIEALLVLPPPVRDVPPSIPEPNDAPPSEDGWRVGGASTPMNGVVPSVAHIEIGLAGSARASGSPLYWGPGMVLNAQVTLDGWLVAAEGHWDAFDEPITLATPGGFNMQTVGVGFAVGRRFEGTRLCADILLGPELLVENEEADGAGEGVGGTSNDVRAHLTARLLPARAAASLRLYGALDADVSPARIRRSTKVDPTLPDSPAWSAALALGVLWELR